MGRSSVRGAARRAATTSLDSLGWSPSTTSAASTSSPRAPIPTWSELDRPRLGSGFRMRRSDRHVDRGLDVVGVVAQHDDRLVQTGLGEPIEHVLEDRPALDRREQLVSTEPRSGPGSQHDRDDPVGLASRDAC